MIDREVLIAMLDDADLPTQQLFPRGFAPARLDALLHYITTALNRNIGDLSKLANIIDYLNNTGDPVLASRRMERSVAKVQASVQAAVARGTLIKPDGRMTSIKEG